MIANNLKNLNSLLTQKSTGILTWSLSRGCGLRERLDVMSMSILQLPQARNVVMPSRFLFSSLAK